MQQTQQTGGALLQQGIAGRNVVEVVDAQVAASDATASLSSGGLRVVRGRVSFQRSSNWDAGAEHLSRQLAAAGIGFPKAPKVARRRNRVIQ